MQRSEVEMRISSYFSLAAGLVLATLSSPLFAEDGSDWSTDHLDDTWAERALAHPEFDDPRDGWTARPSGHAQRAVPDQRALRDRAHRHRLGAEARQSPISSFMPCRTKSRDCCTTAERREEA